MVSDFKRTAIASILFGSLLVTSAGCGIGGFGGEEAGESEGVGEGLGGEQEGEEEGEEGEEGEEDD